MSPHSKQSCKNTGVDVWREPNVLHSVGSRKGFACTDMSEVVAYGKHRTEYSYINIYCFHVSSRQSLSSSTEYLHINNHHLSQESTFETLVSKGPSTPSHCTRSKQNIDVLHSCLLTCLRSTQKASLTSRPTNAHPHHSTQSVTARPKNLSYHHLQPHPQSPTTSKSIGLGGQKVVTELGL